MGKNQARILAEHPDFELRAVCDIDAARADETAGGLGVPAYTDFTAMLRETAPDTVSVTSHNASHAPLTSAAAEAGVRGVYCEKPMATNMAEAHAMVNACRRTNTALVINHQRRLGADLGAMQRLVEQGAIGEVEFIRGDCGGDMLSDGTHLVDSILWLCGDRDVEWVYGGITREITDAMRERAAKRGDEPGTRYGHPVESGATAIVQIKDGPRIELFTGELRTEFRHYQVYQVFGRKGSLWRTGDRSEPNLYISDQAGGGLETGLDDTFMLRPLAAAGNGRGLWRSVDIPLPAGGKELIAEGYSRFAQTIRTGADHPMCGGNALRGFEIVMAVYESARLRKRIDLPLEQDRFPLQLMLDETTAP